MGYLVGSVNSAKEAIKRYIEGQQEIFYFNHTASEELISYFKEDISIDDLEVEDLEAVTSFCEALLIESDREELMKWLYYTWYCEYKVDSDSLIVFSNGINPDSYRSLLWDLHILKIDDLSSLYGRILDCKDNNPESAELILACKKAGISISQLLGVGLKCLHEAQSDVYICESKIIQLYLLTYAFTHEDFTGELPENFVEVSDLDLLQVILRKLSYKGNINYGSISNLKYRVSSVCIDSGLDGSILTEFCSTRSITQTAIRLKKRVSMVREFLNKFIKTAQDLFCTTKEGEFLPDIFLPVDKSGIVYSLVLLKNNKADDMCCEVVSSLTSDITKILSEPMSSTLRKLVVFTVLRTLPEFKGSDFVENGFNECLEDVKNEAELLEML